MKVYKYFIDGNFITKDITDYDYFLLGFTKNHYAYFYSCKKLSKKQVKKMTNKMFERVWGIKKNKFF